MVELIFFYALSAVLLGSAIGVISVRNPVHAALLLVLTFFTAAQLWILLRAEFLGIALILVYVGAVMVLFLFVVMMLDINTAPLREGFTRYLPAGLLVAAVMAAQMIAVLSARNFGFDQFSAPADLPAGYSNTRDVAELLFSKYLMAVQVAALVLIVAVVAALALTLRRREGVRSQDVDAQVAVRKTDRLRVVKMPSEKKVPQA
ncbi:MAG: NADH-quinone oxidoreductase subunit J [Xanthomonadales bacterium]|nr:NADH-quinone oxidoreductase subunit J [Xanthomonadales bacterium]